MAQREQLELTLPAAILALGQMLPSPREWGARRGAAAGPEQLAAQEERILSMLVPDAPARKTMGILDASGKSAVRLRLRAFAYVANRMLRESARGGVDMAEVAMAAMNPTTEPCEALLVARDAVGRMVADGTLEARPEGQCPWNPVLHLPARSLQWVCGGRFSLGLLLPQRLAAARMKGGSDPEIDDVVPAPLSARVIRERIAERVAGMEDGQLDVVSARLSMHMARARMLAAGEDPGTPNEVVLVMGTESGIGKTYLCEQAGLATGLPQAICNAAELTASGYVGLSAEDGLRPLLAAARGRIESCRFGLMGYDEIFRRAGSATESAATGTAVQGEMLRIVQGQLTQVGGKRSGFESSFWVNTYGMFFFLCGCASGLDRLLQRRLGRLAIGYGAGAGRRADPALFRDAMADLGVIPELQTRLTAIVVVKPPSSSTLATASRGVIDNYNRLLASRGCMLYFEEGATDAMARYCLSTRSYYRGLAAITSALAAEAIAREKRDAVVVKASDVGRMVTRMEDGVAVLLGTSRGSGEYREDCNASDDHGCASVGV
jgi:ATP-dependent Clp protease ATP-binding subunit ClpX